MGTELHRSEPWLRLLGIAAIAAFLGLGFMAIRSAVHDWDEGVYWQAIHAIAGGHPLFASVYSAEPPVFYYLLLPFYLIGRSISWLRAGIVLFSALCLAGTYLAARMAAGRRAGLIAMVLLATSPFFLLLAATVQAEVPALALELVAVMLALQSGRSGTKALVWAAAAGVFVSLAAATKLSAVLVVLPVVLYLMAGRHKPLRRIAVAAAGALIAGALLLAPFASELLTVYRELVLHHTVAGSFLSGHISSNLSLLFLRRELPLEVMAAAGVLLAGLNRDIRVLPPLTWAAATSLAVLLYQPLFPHHLVLLCAPLALTAGVGLSSFDALTGPGNLRRLAAAAIPALVLLAAFLGVIVDARDRLHEPRQDARDAMLAAALEQETTPAGYVITDNPWAAALGGRWAPPELVDTSRQRIASGLLTTPYIAEIASRYRVRAVLLDGNRLRGTPGFSAWLAGNFRQARAFSRQASIYVR